MAEQISRTILSWDELTKAALLRFGPTDFDDPTEALSQLQQTTTVAAYQEAFERLSNRVDNLPEGFLISSFIACLKEEVRLDEKIKHPNTLPEAIEVACLIEERNQIQQKTTSPFRKSTTPPKGDNDPTVRILEPPPTSRPNNGSANSLIDFRGISNQEAWERREKGFCYYCDDKFVLDHRCRSWPTCMGDLVLLVLGYLILVLICWGLAVSQHPCRASFSKPLEEGSICGNAINRPLTPIHVSFPYTFSLCLCLFSLSESVASQANRIRSSTGSSWFGPTETSQQARPSLFVVTILGLHSGVLYGVLSVKDVEVCISNVLSSSYVTGCQHPGVCLFLIVLIKVKDALGSGLVPLLSPNLVFENSSYNQDSSTLARVQFLKKTWCSVANGAGGSGVPWCCIVFIIWDSYRSTCFDESSLREMLIEAVQPCLDFVVADFNCLQRCRRKQQCRGVFAWLDQLSNMSFEVLQSLLSVFVFAGALGIYPSAS
ncbi:hypothetical protein FNV43_RR11187 [Rhamnella rubrinervis]|uniref:Retrotransposon gag domain-containing protein n=1 Tax=Rhamnella rubrinervis TaxID=2594499 RepID=A0A8K0H5N7_9ROSA|nr:hypothetical protein FNV43_RR11187 [Rhamnella rubrinervis]